MVEAQPPNNPAPGLSPFSGAFVGRREESAVLKSTLEDTISGQGIASDSMNVSKTSGRRDFGRYQIRCEKECRNACFTADVQQLRRWADPLEADPDWVEARRP